MTENQEESFLKEKEGQIRKTLADLSFSDKQLLERSMLERAKRVHSKVIRGTGNEMYSALCQCLRIDLKEHIYLGFDSCQDPYYPPVHLACFQCAHSKHCVGRSGPEEYIAVFHPRISQEEAEGLIRERHETWGVS